MVSPKNNMEKEAREEEETIREPKRPKQIEPGENSRSPTEVETESEAEQTMKCSITVTFADPDVFDCCICFESLSPPIFQCENGHIACSACCPKIGFKCPSCSLPIGYKTCLAIEKVVESMKIPCPNAGFGCQENIIYGYRGTHEQGCPYTPCNCPISSCDFTGSPSQLSQHFISAHSSVSRQFNYRQRFTVCMDRSETFAVLQSVDDGLLFLVKNRKEELQNSIAVVLIGAGALGSQTEFWYDLVAKRGATSLKIHSKVVCFKGLAGAATNEVLVVPRDVFSCPRQIKLDVCIKQP